jgi:hypothetical protein
MARRILVGILGAALLALSLSGCAMDHAHWHSDGGNRGGHRSGR